LNPHLHNSKSEAL